jgi:hypothetical protein
LIEESGIWRKRDGGIVVAGVTQSPSSIHQKYANKTSRVSRFLITGDGESFPKN